MRIKEIATFLLLIIANAVFAQENLYVGYVGWGGAINDNLTVIDTTGGNFSPTGADILTLTNDEYDVYGTYGLAVHPSTGEMYILYQTGPGASATRRLGVVNTETGDITDVGMVGNLRDLTFAGDTLFGATGSQYDDYQLVRIDTETAVITDVLSFDQQNGGTTINYNYYTGALIKLDDGNMMESVDMITYASSSTIHGGHPPGDLQASALLDVDHQLVSVRENLYNYEISTKTFELISSYAVDVHGMTFGGYPEGFVGQRLEKATTFTIYPVPTTDKLTIQFAKLDENVTQIEILDASGKILLTESVPSPSVQELSLDISNLESGVYLVRVNGENQRYTQKIIKK